LPDPNYFRLRDVKYPISEERVLGPGSNVGREGASVIKEGRMGIRIDKKAGLIVLLVMVASMAATSAETWSFGKFSRIKLDGVSGDVTLLSEGRGEIVVQLDSDVRPASAFDARVEEDGDTLRITEEWRGSGSGRVSWTIYVPQGAGPEIRISSASGSLDARGISARLDLETASGSIDLNDVELRSGSELSTASGSFTLRNMTAREGTEFSTASGDFNLIDLDLEQGVEMSTASGDIQCDGCRGQMELSTASGDVRIRASRIEGASEFSSASGDVILELDSMPEENLSASSASGDVRLRSADFSGSYSLVLIAREDRGRIVSPFRYTSSRTFEDYHVYEEKKVERGSGGPRIKLRTASGSVIVEED
jgi:DUF4097 and DUF4098 domain-containing protein YvlB